MECTRKCWVRRRALQETWLIRCPLGFDFGLYPGGDPVSVLIAGWFSFGDGLATAGDLHAAELVYRWLTGAGYPSEVATVPPFGNGIDWRSADPAAYTHVVFVCGPFGQYPGELEFLSRFAECCPQRRLQW